MLNLEAGGLERLVADMVRTIDPAEWDVHVLALQFLGREGRGLEDVATVHEAAEPFWHDMIWPKRLARQIRRIGPDVVHSHSGVWHKASLAARMSGVPRVIHTDHGRPRLDEPWIDRFVDRRASRRTDRVVAVSSSVRDVLLEMGVEESRLAVITNGIDTDRFQPRARSHRLRKILGWPEDAFVLGSLGRLDPIKGYDVMIEAFHILVSEMRPSGHVGLVVAGEGEEHSRLTRLIAELGLEPHVSIVGWREDPEIFLSELDLFCLASRSEGTSISLLEAMSSGLCPVVTDVGGNAAVLGSELAHRLVPPENPRALAEALRQAIEESERRRADCVKARRRVDERFALRDMVGAYVRLYRGNES